MTNAIAKLAAALAFMFALAGTARADAIDGEWCASDGAHMSIAGPDVTTPGGMRIKGNYSRHAFDYVVPTGETGAGEPVNILLRGGIVPVRGEGPATEPAKK